MSRCIACNHILTVEEMKHIDYIDSLGNVTYADMCDSCKRESNSEYNILEKEYLFSNLTSNLDFKKNQEKD
jgi:hypothetical protein